MADPSPQPPLAPAQSTITRTVTAITVNGRTYRSVDEMPADVRRQYEQVISLMADRDGSGIPDVFEGRAAGEPARITTGETVVTHLTTTTHEFDGDPAALPRRGLPRLLREGGNARTGGIAIDITWPTLLALVALAAALVVGWTLFGRG